MHDCDHVLGDQGDGVLGSGSPPPPMLVYGRARRRKLLRAVGMPRQHR